MTIRLSVKHILLSILPEVLHGIATIRINSLGKSVMQRPLTTCILFIFSTFIFSAFSFAQEKFTFDQLRDSDYMKGKQIFQGRCSACHTLADNSSDLTGPNLWGIFDRWAGKKEGFVYSDSFSNTNLKWSPDKVSDFLSDPIGYIPGNIMGVPEPVPLMDHANLIAFMLIETGAVDWPRPETNFAANQEDKSRPPSERFPSFWNHLMFNATRYHWINEEAGEDFRFDVYVKTDGSIASSEKSINGFWYIDKRDFFCYALTGLPVSVGHMVECFPVGAMAIPRFADRLWTSKPQPGVKLHGGMIPGRPDWVYGEN
ncbi:MAG: c-type cytochrome [Pseudomonadota bacterium]|nr:c-type cytochrome [Pseudomonadota bacterium]